MDELAQILEEMSSKIQQNNEQDVNEQHDFSRHAETGGLNDKKQLQNVTRTISSKEGIVIDLDNFHDYCKVRYIFAHDLQHKYQH